MTKKKTKKKKAAKKTTKKSEVKKGLAQIKQAIDQAPGPTITPMPTAGPKVQDFENILDRQLAGDKPVEKKRGPGRPPGPPKESEPEQAELTIEVVAGVVKIPFEFWAISQGVDVLKLDDKEAQRIAEPAKQLIEYYLPSIPVIAYAWISLTSSAFWAMRSRLILVKALQEKKEAEQPAAAKPAPVTQTGVIAKFPDLEKPQKV